MGWETRKNGEYYYKKERINGKVRSVYYGNNETAQIIALLDEIHRDRGELEKAEEFDAVEAGELEIDAEIEKFSALNKACVDALFLINSYHRHKRQWRRKRK